MNDNIRSILIKSTLMPTTASVIFAVNYLRAFRSERSFDFMQFYGGKSIEDRVNISMYVSREL